MNGIVSFQPNQKLEVIVGKKNFRRIYKSRIEEITKEYMLLAMPMNRGIPIILPVDEEFQGRLIMDGSVYQFFSRYQNKRHDPIPVWVASLPYNITRIQQRDHVRVDVSLKVVLQFSVAETEEITEINTISKDISGGGILVVTRTSIPLRTNVLLNISIPEIGDIAVKGDVVRREQPQEDQLLYWIGIRFTDITEKQRNMIIKHVFKVQLEHRKKGL